MKRVLVILISSICSITAATADDTNVHCEHQSTTPLVKLIGKGLKVVRKESYAYLNCDKYKGFVLSQNMTGIESISLNNTEVSINEIEKITGKKISNLDDVMTLPSGDFDKLIADRSLSYPVEFTGISAKSVDLYGMNKNQNGTTPDFNTLSASLKKPYRKYGCYYISTPIISKVEGSDACIISYQQVGSDVPSTYACLKSADKGCPTCDTCLYQDDDNKEKGLSYLKISATSVVVPEDILKEASVIKGSGKKVPNTDAKGQ